MVGPKAAKMPSESEDSLSGAPLVEELGRGDIRKGPCEIDRYMMNLLKKRQRKPSKKAVKSSEKGSSFKKKRKADSGQRPQPRETQNPSTSPSPPLLPSSQ